MNIVWMCLTTIFSCVYVSCHYAVPKNLPQMQSGIPWYKFYKNWYVEARWFLRERGVDLLLALAAPELTLLRASRQSYECNIGVKIMDHLDFVEWTISHSFLVQMKGFEEESGKIFDEDYSFYEWVLNEYEKTKGFQLDIKGITEHITDRSKSNSFAKTVATLQIIWVLVQTIARYIESLPISQLELVTCAYVVCSVPVCFLWMLKPYNIRGRYTLRNHEKTSSESTNRKIEKGQEIRDLIKELRLGSKLAAFRDTST